MTTEQRANGVLFVCLGNICRSPTAEGVFRQLLAREAPTLATSWSVDSAGTADYHSGAPPDPRTVAAARARGYELAHLRARQIEPADFSRFALVLAMDRSNLSNLRALAPDHLQDRIGLFLDHAPELSGREVPDPYYGTPAGFELVIDLVEIASRGLILSLQQRAM